MPSGVRCCVIGCQATSHTRDGTKLENGIRFFSIPKVKEHAGDQMKEITTKRKLAWIAAIGRQDITFDRQSHGLRVCSNHFQSGAPAYEMLQSDPDWTPTLNLGHDEVQRMDRRARSQSRTYKPKDVISDKTDCDNKRSVKCDSMCQTDLSLQDITEMELEINKFKRNRDSNNITMSSFENDDEKVKYFTALPTFFILSHLFSYLKPHFPSEGAVSPFQMLMIVFLRLRLNLPVQFIAYLFNIHRSTAANIFTEALCIMYTRMSPMIFWPSRDCLKENMPQEFVGAFGSNVAVIVDCFEILIEKPSSLKAEDQTCTHYEQHSDILKYLIGITPQGVIYFISKGWGGRTSDYKSITENSGFLNNLQPQDVVLADRGFDIEESVGLMCAEVKISAFTQGKCQMGVRNIEQTRKLAHLRIHVESVVGSVVKKYSILSNAVPSNLVIPCEGEETTVLDKIVTLACVLTNLCQDVVHVI